MTEWGSGSLLCAFPRLTDTNMQFWVYAICQFRGSWGQRPLGFFPGTRCSSPGTWQWFTGCSYTCMVLNFSPHSFPLGKTFSRRNGWGPAQLPRALETTFGQSVLRWSLLGSQVRFQGRWGPRNNIREASWLESGWVGWGTRPGDNPNITAHISQVFRFPIIFPHDLFVWVS